MSAAYPAGIDERSNDERIRIAYKYRFPEKTTDRGYQKDFIEVLATHAGIKIGKSTLVRWLTHGVPVDRLVDMEETIRVVQIQAITLLQSGIDEVKGGT